MITSIAEDVSQSQDSEEGEEDNTIIVTPKPPADQPIKDDSSLLAVRSKLFYKKADSYVDLGDYCNCNDSIKSEILIIGVGILRVKEVQSKGVLLMRNETTLGNILLNISLSSQIPVSRAGKNNVLIISPPNPPLDFKSTNQNEQTSPQSSNGEMVTYVIRVKTSELADQLFELIKTLKSKS